LKELLHCLFMVTFADEKKLLEYLLAYNSQFLYQRAGYVLSHFKKSMKLTEHFFSECKIHIHKSKRYLYDGIQYESPVYSGKWQIYVLNDLMRIINEGGDAIV